MSIADLIRSHEAYVMGRPGGCRVAFRMERIPNLRLINRKLNDIEFVGCDLSHSHFTLSTMRSASLYCASLVSVDLRGVNLERADLRGAILRGANLYRANLDGADFRRAVLFKSERDKEFSKMDWVPDDESRFPDGAVDFRDSSLAGAHFGCAKLAGADFSGALMDGASLSNADLRGAKFDNAVLSGVVFGNARLDGASFDGALRDPSEALKLRRAEWLEAVRKSDQYTRTYGQEGGRADLAGSDLRVIGDALAGKGLVGANMRGVCGASVSFAGASLVGAVFDGADLRGANFTGALLQGVSFRDCNLKHAVFSKANLTAFVGASGRKFYPSFDGAQTDGARFDQAQTENGLELPVPVSVNPVPVNPVPESPVPVV